MKSALVSSLVILAVTQGRPCAGSYTFTNFDAAGPLNPSVAYGINDSSQVVGYYTVSGLGHGFVRSADGTITTFDAPKSIGYTVATGINDAGVITGYFPPAPFQAEGFLRSADGATFTNFTGTPNIGFHVIQSAGINNDGVVVGETISDSTSSVFHAFIRLADGTYTTFDVPTSLGRNQTGASAINDLGQIVGGYGTPGASHSFLRSADGTFVDIVDPLGSGGTFATAINDAGIIAGYYSDGSADHGFVRSADGTFTTVDDPSGAKGTIIDGINNVGQIVGMYLDGAGQSHAFVATANAVPEPSSLALAASGLVALGVRLHRRRAGWRRGNAPLVVS